MVNPRRRRRKSNPRHGGRPTVVVVRAGGARRNVAMPMMVAQNPRRVRRSNPRRRRRNPRRVALRRSYRRNPFDLDLLMDVGLRAGAAAAGSYLVNKLLISKVGVDAQGRDTQYGMIFRNLLRVGLGAVGVAWVGGTLGTAWAGAMLYPAMFELDQWWSRPAGTATAGATGRFYKGEDSLDALGAGDAQSIEAALSEELDAELAGMGAY
jgi:hypothetical protein